MKKPCTNCPWRVDAPREYWDPTHFASIWHECQDDGWSTMLCHKATALPTGTPDVKLPICQGWIRVVGFEAVGVRLAVAQGQITIDEVNDTTSVELFPNFKAMLRANKVRIGPRNRFLKDEDDER